MKWWEQMPGSAMDSLPRPGPAGSSVDSGAGVHVLELLVGLLHRAELLAGTVLAGPCSLPWHSES